MKLEMTTFYKYQGTGNDFVIIDDREEQFDISNQPLIKKLCDRKFGIGADGLMLLRNKSGFDFEMVYFNSDGRVSSMCGNGGRCIVAFAHFLGVIKEKCHFIAIDGPHDATINQGIVSLQMQNVDKIQQLEEGIFMDTGSPHVVNFLTNNVKEIDLVPEARAIRYNERFEAEGTNVNFAHVEAGEIQARTYERGVEDETLSCGTGVTAIALAAHQQGLLDQSEIAINTSGGQLKVSFTPNEKGYTNIWLTGPTTFVFKGEIEV